CLVNLPCLPSDILCPYTTLFRSMIDELDLLVLDDIGSEYVKANEYGYESWASDVLYKVFDMRLNKSIICSTNYSVAYQILYITQDRKSTRLNSSHVSISYAVFCL